MENNMESEKTTSNHSQEQYREVENSFEDKRALKEQIFLAVIFDKLIDAFEDDLYDSGAEEEDVSYFRKKVSHRDQKDILSILSLPKDIRSGLFKRCFSEENSGNNAIDKIISVALDGNKKYGFTLGYHVSDKDIIPSKNGWVITPSEFDDRDEMKMAYYSLDYENFYRKKPAKYVYFVRAETGENSSHKKDTSDRWSRATQLSIVDKVSLIEIDSLVKELYNQELKNATTPSVDDNK